MSAYKCRCSRRAAFIQLFLLQFDHLIDRVDDVLVAAPTGGTGSRAASCIAVVFSTVRSLALVLALALASPFPCGHHFIGQDGRVVACSHLGQKPRLVFGKLAHPPCMLVRLCVDGLGGERKRPVRCRCATCTSTSTLTSIINILWCDNSADD